MKRMLIACALVSLLPAQFCLAQKIIRIGTSQIDLILQVAPNGRLAQSYFGARLANESDIQQLPAYLPKPGSDGSAGIRSWEVYPGSGGEDYFEPAIAIQHNDGNLTTILKYTSSSVKQLDANVTQTDIVLNDSIYKVEVTLHYITYAMENTIKSWTDIRHQEKKPVFINQYASAMLYVQSPKYYLTEFSGDWAREAGKSTQQLQFGKKILDTKLGSRAAMQVSPFFQLGLDREANENSGKVLVGTLGWTGNFRFTFEVDNLNNLRVIAGINPYASNYELSPNETFTTPEFIYTLSEQGTGKASRDLHRWARNYQLKDGNGNRLTLLNNWETTEFDFDAPKLGEMMKEAKTLGVDMFLLDDGWFGNKYPRVNDRAGLGDWEVMHSKLPDGVPSLVTAAKEAGVKFGIWIEPEMVNPKSELFEKHPDWAITQPNRQTYYYRNQLVLDLSNPAVQDYVFSVVDKLMTENPSIAYFKWDCNSPITNIYSPYLKEKQGNLYINHVRGVNNVFKRVSAKYPNLPMMLCSGGGARCDYEALKYFTEFWCSDDTDPFERLYIQWGFSQFFPAKAMAAHVTSWNKSASIKFRVEVAMMCKLGFDINLKSLSEADQQFCQNAVANYKRLKPVILNGDQYRLMSPYDFNHSSVMYVSPAKNNVVLFGYDLHPRFSEILYPVKLQGLDATKMYTITETNLMPGAKATLVANGKTYSGDYLMKVGLDVFTATEGTSKVVELTAR